MHITTRPLTSADKEQALWVEAGAMPRNRYLAEVWNLFTREGGGALLGAFVGHDLAGLGKITRLYGDYGWLETLRVHPDWQRKGVGRAVWRGYFEEMEKMGLKSAGMYTEDYNVASKTLAESFGLTVRGFYTEHVAPAEPAPAAEAEFSPVPADRGEAVLSKHYHDLPPYLVVNRTFYPVAEGLGRHCAARGWLHQNRTGGVLVAGNRFHPQRLLHCPYSSGEADQALAEARRLAAAQGAPSISRLAPAKASSIPPQFRRADSFMTLWIDL